MKTKTIDSSVIKNKVKKELNKNQFIIEVKTYDKEATLLFKSDWLNMMMVEVLITFSVHKNEEFNWHTINGMSYKEDLSTVQIEDMDFVLEYNGTEHEIDLSDYEETFSEIISGYYTPSDL